MTYDPRLLVRGLLAALRAPFWLDGARLRILLEGCSGSEVPDDRHRTVLAWSVRFIRLLARLPGGRWRNTCLYRSVAEALVLRDARVAIKLRIGARSDGDALAAHAWVEVGGRVLQDDYTLLVPVPRATS